MTQTAESLFGIFPNRESVEEAVSALRTDGFQESDIAVVISETPARDLAHQKRTKALEGMALGSLLGASIMGALGWLFSTGMLATSSLPYVTRLTSMDPALATLAGIGAGGLLGGFIGLFIGSSVPEYVARRYKGRLRKKGILFSVHCENENCKTRAESILKRTGGEKLGVKSETSGDYAVLSPPSSKHASTRPASIRDSRPLASPSSAMASARVPEDLLTKPSITSPSWATGSLIPAEASPSVADDLDPTGPTPRICARELMSTNIKVVEDTATLAQAAEEMRLAGISLLLVRSENSIAGVVTDRDIAVRASAEGYDPNTTPVRSVMTSHYNYCREDQDLAEVANIMEEKHVHRLPVLDRAMRLVGVISLKDLATRAKSARLEGQVLRLVAAEKD